MLNWIHTCNLCVAALSNITATAIASGLTGGALAGAITIGTQVIGGVAKFCLQHFAVRSTDAEQSSSLLLPLIIPVDLAKILAFAGVLITSEPGAFFTTVAINEVVSFFTLCGGARFSIFVAKRAVGIEGYNPYLSLPGIHKLFYFSLLSAASSCLACFVSCLVFTIELLSQDPDNASPRRGQRIAKR